MMARLYRTLQNLPIRRKLLVMSLLVSSFSIVSLSATFLINQTLHYRKYAENDIKVQASIIEKNIASALLFQDQRSAHETLEALRYNRRIQALAVFTADQQLFSVYLNTESGAGGMLPEFIGLQSRHADIGSIYHSLIKTVQQQEFMSAYPVFLEPVIVDQQQVGTIFIQANLQDVYTNMLLLALLVVLVSCLTLLIALGMGMAFQRVIAEPIDAMLETMQQVSANKDFSRRIASTTTDELGQLISGFNQMLAEIESRDQSLIERQQQLDKMAHYDNLTGLANRAMLLDRLHQALHQAKRYKLMMAILFIDLDHFKEINDSLGHKAGDELLKQVATRLDSMVRGSDTLARLGGDEFTICLHNVLSVENACVVAQKIVELYAQPFQLEGKPCTVTGSVGVAFYPHDGQTVEELMKAADTAMYHAKQNGKNNFQLYSAEMQMQASEHFNLQKKLTTAIENKELFLEYQPIVGTDSGRIISVEALLRWNHPELGVLHPKEFLTVAAGTEMVHRIGAWVLSQACHQCAIWQQSGNPELQVSVNVFTEQFNKADFAETVFGILKETGLAAASLQLDLAESIITLTCKEALEQVTYSPAKNGTDLPCPYGTGHSCALHPLYRFKDAGIQLAFDNFGTGYSSLGYLNHLPIEIIKIDRQFIQCSEGSKGAAILGAIIAMAGSLGLQIVAEGVETEAQYTILKQLGFDRVQGYLTGRPMLPETLDVLLSTQTTPPSTQGVSPPDV